MPAAACHGANPGGIQRRNDMMNAIVDTLNFAVYRDANLVFKCFYPSWDVTMLAV